MIKGSHYEQPVTTKIWVAADWPDDVPFTPGTRVRFVQARIGYEGILTRMAVDLGDKANSVIGPVPVVEVEEVSTVKVGSLL